MALVVTLACLPLLVLDLMGGHGGDASEAAVTNPDVVPTPSLVVAVDPPEAPTTSSTDTTAAPTTSTQAPATTTTTTARVASTTTTAAPRVAAPPAPKPTTTTTTAAPAIAAPPPPRSAFDPSASESAFLACVRQRESRGDYTVADPSGQFMGAYQIYQGGWDAVARSIGRSDLVGVKPNRAAPYDQDVIALNMLRQYGRSPWGGSCG